MYYYNHTGNFEPGAVKTQSARAERRLAQAYVPEQKFRELYTAEEALKYGTIFKELNQGYMGRK